jgi:hypothetical protein
MGIGQLNKIVTFKLNTPTVKGAGKEDAYTTLLSTRGSMKQLSGSRQLAYGEISEGVRWELIVRFETYLEAALSMKLKVEYDSRTYTVDSWEKIGEKRFYYKFILSEQRS